MNALPYWLVLDAGNSALKWALVEGALVQADSVEAASAEGTWVNDARGDGAPLEGTPAAPPAALSVLPPFQTLAQGWLVNTPVDTLAHRLQEAWRVLPQRPVAGFACRVAGDALAAAAQTAAQELWGLPLHWFSAQAHFDHAGVQLRSGYRNPTQLGADRWHALIAARAAYPEEALVVINSGTATTIDCLRADGLFAGGVIAPGLRLMFDSLARNTAQLPRLDDAAAEAALSAHPDDTEAAITGGVLGAQLGLIERNVARFHVESGGVRVLLAGGQAARLASLLETDGVLAALGVPLQLEDNLVLRGVHLQALAWVSQQPPQ